MATTAVLATAPAARIGLLPLQQATPPDELARARRHILVWVRVRVRVRIRGRGRGRGRGRVIVAQVGVGRHLG